MFQGEMGSEGQRGLPGESGNKGATVRRLWRLNNMYMYMFIWTPYRTLCSFVALVVDFLYTQQGDNGLPGPRGSPGTPGESGRNVGYRLSLGIISKHAIPSFFLTQYCIVGYQRWPWWSWTKRRAWTAWTKSEYLCVQTCGSIFLGLFSVM